ncbi:NACHT, LRR and PYD domains-containing protein 12-like [Colossoma macropomum]|uniref:NACHT, LRR and PYD domains-containing protein 12-like n=1 Tax=Colossoma macropomum TaxID=42526 RepID=UPI001863C288|nr:NACHT, LRR and PYD domains-containing protein 12-like [Colossoma macropomum]
MNLSEESEEDSLTSLKHLCPIQQERSDSPIPSCMSMKSDRSIHPPPEFKDRDSSSGHSAIQQERSDSPIFSCASMKSDRSIHPPPEFKDSDPSSGHSQIQQERSDCPGPSCVSMKSDRSIHPPPEFKDRDPSSEHSLIQQERSDSPEPSCVSLKSDRSIHPPPEFKDGDPSSRYSQIQQDRSDSPTPSLVSVKSDACIHPEFKDRDPSSGHGSVPAYAEKETQEDFKLTLKNKFQCLREITTTKVNPTLLSEIYTELYITEGDCGEVNNEHEVRQIEAASRRTTTEDTAIKCNDIFKPLSEQDKPIRTMLTKGVAGIGKTVSVQKFIVDWAEDKANQDVQFIFPLPFRELNLMKDQKLSLLDLLHKCFKETKEMEISSLHKPVFIFDGLDECRLPLDFQSRVNICDVTQPSSVDMLLINLIKGNLLPSALIWITSRPAAAEQIPSECVDRVTEVRGFTDPQKEEYFRKRISDQSLASKVIKHLKKSKSLCIMCHIPVFCWISATVLERMLGEAESGEIPKTLTQMYTHFLIIQTKIIREKYTKNQKTDEDMLLKMGQLAFQQLRKGHLIFYEEDLRECSIDVEEASVYSGVCTQIFREESGLLQSKVYCFVHLSVQEHLAALYVHLTFMNQKRNVLKQSLFSKRNSLKTKISDVHRSAVDQALQSKNGHLDLFLRFLLGFSLESNETLLHDLVTQRGSSSYSKEETVQYIKKKIKENSSAEKSINLFHCLNELNDHGLVEEVQQYLKSGDLQTGNLSSSQWSAVVFVLLTSSQKIDVFDLHKYTKSYSGSEDVFLKLLPVVAASRTVHLTNSNLKRKSWAALASVISSECSSVRELHLSRNELGDSGVKLLSAGLENLHCKLETLWLLDCNITVVGCPALASALKSNPSHLKVLDLSRNKIGNSGIKLLSAGLEDPHCKVKTLKLECCNITDKGCAALASVLASNPSHLKELNLYGNKLGDSGVKLLSVELENPQCNLEILWLRYCNITDEGCAALASALKTNPSHLRELHLSGNKLGDSGVKLLSDVLQNPLCKLEILWLQFCNITDEGCAALASALKSNPSHLKELDLSGNVRIKTGCRLLLAIKHDNHYRLQDLRLIFNPVD